MSPQKHFNARMTAHQHLDTIGVAVSGGADSMGMLHMAKQWADTHNVTLRAFTFDHNLRPTSTQEAHMVGDWCTAHGIHHTIDTWSPPAAGNMLENARHARYKAINAWRDTMSTVLIGHTKTDRAETVIMRLLRGSGVDGLAGLQPTRTHHSSTGSYTIHRPLVDLTRQTLRTYCQTHHVPFVDDPSNDNTAYLRIQTRALMRDTSMDEDSLVNTARRMHRASQALTHYAEKFFTRHAKENLTATDKTLTFPLSVFLEEPLDTQMRLVRLSIEKLTTPTHPPRESAVTNVVEALTAHKSATLGGCLFRTRKNTITITPEHQPLPLSVSSHDT